MSESTLCTCTKDPEITCIIHPKAKSFKGNDMNKEPDIIINDVQLNQGQAFTMRNAIANFARYLNEEGLGDDDAGKLITAGYLARAAEIESLIMGD